MKPLKYCFLTATLAFATVSHANDWHTSGVKRIYPHADGVVLVSFDTDAPSCTNGNTPKYHFMAVGQNGVTAEGQQQMYALLLTAATTGMQVRINFDASSNNCYINRMHITY